MATKRVSSSAVDWAKYAAINSKHKIEIMRTLKAKHDGFLSKVQQLPEELPKIDFASYKSRLPNPAMADNFSKSYAALKIPYPVDKAKLSEQIDSELKKEEAEVTNWKAEVQKQLDFSKKYLTTLRNLPKYEEMSDEMMHYYFPELIRHDYARRPKYWPLHEDTQPYNRDHEDNNYINNKVGIFYSDILTILGPGQFQRFSKEKGTTVV